MVIGDCTNQESVTVHWPKSAPSVTTKQYLVQVRKGTLKPVIPSAAVPSGAARNLALEARATARSRIQYFQLVTSAPLGAVFVIHSAMAGR